MRDMSNMRDYVAPMVSDLNNLLGFDSVSFVKLDAPIKSRWQADFLQVFPPTYHELPFEHETDKVCFERYFRGKEKITFEEFKKKHYERNANRKL